MGLRPGSSALGNDEPYTDHMISFVKGRELAAWNEMGEKYFISQINPTYISILKKKIYTLMCVFYIVFAVGRF